MKMPADLNGIADKLDPVYFSESKSFSASFAEGQGTTTMSYDGAINGNITGAEWIKDGYYGNALSFDGVDDNLYFADSDSIDFGTEDFSIEFWLRCNAGDDVAGQRILSKRIGDLGYEVYFGDNGKLKVFIGDGSNVLADNLTNWGYCDNKWTHVALSFSRSGNLTFSKDILPFQTVSISNVSGSLANDAPLYIGSDATSNYGKFAIDSLIFHKNVLLNLYDNAGRVTNGPEFLVINSRNASTGAFGVINQGSSGAAGVMALLDPTNTGGFPLQILNEASDSSSGNEIHNLIFFGKTSGNFGNLKWDGTNNRFIFDRGINQQGNTYTNILEGNTAIGSTNAPTEALDVTGNIKATGSITGSLRLNGGSSPGSTCTAGDVTYDTEYIYVCIDTDTWAKAAITP